MARAAHHAAASCSSGCRSSARPSPSPRSRPPAQRRAPTTGASAAAAAAASAAAGTPGASACRRGRGDATAEPTPVPTPGGRAVHLQLGRATSARTTVTDFEDEVPGIKVKYDKFPDAATQITKIRSDGKGGGYDVTYPASTEIPALSRDGVIQPLDLGLIPNVANLGAGWQNPAYDPGNKYSMPNYWWTTGFAWDPDKVQATRPAGRRSGTSSTRATRDARRPAGGLRGRRRSASASTRTRPTRPSSTSRSPCSSSRSRCSASTPRTTSATSRAAAVDDPRLVRRLVPDDSTTSRRRSTSSRARAPSAARTRWSCCPGAPHPVAANLWINFNLDAQVSADNSNYIGYMGPNAAAQQFIDPAILERPEHQPEPGGPRQARSSSCSSRAPTSTSTPSAGRRSRREPPRPAEAPRVGRRPPARPRRACRAADLPAARRRLAGGCSSSRRW